MQDMLNCDFVLTEIAVGKAGEAPCQRQMGIQRKRSLMQHTGFLGTLMKKATDVSNQGQGARITGI